MSIRIGNTVYKTASVGISVFIGEKLLVLKEKIKETSKPNLSKRGVKVSKPYYRAKERY